jgi:hypothetical protein
MQGKLGANLPRTGVNSLVEARRLEISGERASENWINRLRLQLLSAAVPYVAGHLVAGGWLQLRGVAWAPQAPLVLFLLGTVLLAWAANTVETELRKHEADVPPQSAVYMAQGALLALTPLFWLALRLA